MSCPCRCLRLSRLRLSAVHVLSIDAGLVNSSKTSGKAVGRPSRLSLLPCSSKGHLGVLMRCLAILPPSLTKYTKSYLDLRITRQSSKTTSSLGVARVSFAWAKSGCFAGFYRGIFRFPNFIHRSSSPFSPPLLFLFLHLISFQCHPSSRLRLTKIVWFRVLPAYNHIRLRGAKKIERYR